MFGYQDLSEHTDRDFYLDKETGSSPHEGFDFILEEDDEDLTSSGADLDEEDSSGDGRALLYCTACRI